MTNFIETLFSVKVDGDRKNIRIAGIKISLKKRSLKQIKTDINPYQEDHKQHLKTKYISANSILEIFSKYYLPTSVVDFGCGVGAFLKAWKDRGVRTVKGLDLYASKSCELMIDKSEFETVDLNNYSVSTNLKYDLAMSLEVAEHISAEASENFIKILTSLSDIILFSAAIPYQPGTEHINCQPPQYWADLFAKQGFDCFDFIRTEAMKNEKIEWWYSQNILVFARNDKKELLLSQGLKVDDKPMFFYHPEHIKFLVNKG